MDQSPLSSRAIIGMFYEQLALNLGQSWIPGVSMEVESDQEIEEFKWLGMTPAMREWVGGRLAKGLRVNGMQIRNKPFEATLEVSVDDLRRDKTGQIEIRIGEFADRVNSHWASLLSALLLTAETAACYDGQAFFDTDHSEGESGTQSNDLAEANYGELNVGTPTNPTAYELSNVILKMIQHMYGIKDDRGEPMNEMAKEFLVMVPIPFFGAAVQATSLGTLNTGSGVQENPLTANGMKITAVANPRLTWTAKLALFRTDGRAKPMIRQTEVDLEVAALAEGSEYEFTHRKHQYGVYTSRNVGFGLWQHAIMATLN